MNKVIVIVDFNNVFRGSITSITKQQYETFFSDVIQRILSFSSEMPSEILIRLYGGWYESNNLTNNASDVLSKIELVDLFPIILNKNKIDGSIEIANIQFGLNKIWYNTIQEKAGLPRLRIDENYQSDRCSLNKLLCPVHILRKFVQKKQTICQNEGCSTVHNKVFYRREQKMVDTMMTCDIISYSSERNVSSVYVITDDVDLFPGMAISKIKHADVDVCLFVRTENQKKSYQRILDDYNINVKSLDL